MAPLEIYYGDIKTLLGREIGVSDWYEVTQEDVNAFGRTTHDEQWIHVDVERAKKESPFGGPVAHGYYTLSLIPHLMDQIWTVKGSTRTVNCGLNKLRFVAPVPVGSRIRLRARLSDADDIPSGVQVVIRLNIMLESRNKLACAADGVFRYYG